VLALAEDVAQHAAGGRPRWGWCPHHAERWGRLGDPPGNPEIPRTLLRRCPLLLINASF